jgi:hypothetical protein
MRMTAVDMWRGAAFAFSAVANGRGAAGQMGLLARRRDIC